jgi:hypothetical protein
MSFGIPDDILDYVILAIKDSDAMVVCSSYPTTFFNACWPSSWSPETIYNVGDITHPPTVNNFVYECVTGGNSGSIEPPWGTLQDAEFTDGGAEWKTHESYSLAKSALLPEDLVLTADSPPQKVLTVAGKTNITAHQGGTVGHVALLNEAGGSLRYSATSVTSEAGTNVIVKGRVVQIESFTITSNGVS